MFLVSCSSINIICISLLLFLRIVYSVIEFLRHLKISFIGSRFEKEEIVVIAALEELKFLNDVETLVLKFVLVTFGEGRLGNRYFTINSLNFTKCVQLKPPSSCLSYRTMKCVERY